MSIEKAALLSFARNKLELKAGEIDNIDEEIGCILGDLLPYNFLEAQDTSKTLSDGSTSFTVPSDYQDVISIVLNDGSVNLAPLLPMEGGYKGYREAMNRVMSGVESVPKYHAYFNGIIYVYPTADQAFTIIFDYYKKNALDADSIEYGDEFTNLFKFGAAYYLAMSLGLSRYIAIWQPAYNNQIQTMVLAHPGQPRHVGG